MALIVTDSAAAQLGTIVAEHGIEETQGLRLFARSGGGCACSGPAFGMTIDKPAAEDQVIVVAGIRFIIDPLSAPNLDGASIDYIDSVMQQGFTIEAPAALATDSGGGCACGGHGAQESAHAHGAPAAGGCACGGHGAQESAHAHGAPAAGGCACGGH